MKLKDIELVNFRNHYNTKIQPSLKTLITGNNGQGKTNILDAVHHVLNPKEKCTHERNVRFNQEMARISLVLNDDEVEIKADLIIDSYGKIYRENKKRLNKKSINLFSVYFKPDDLKITAGQPSNRRSFLNEVCIQLCVGYANNLRDYTRAVKNKNLLLKKGSPRSQIEPWNKKIAELGALIYIERKKVCQNIQEEAKACFNEFNEGELVLKYCSHAKGSNPEEELSNLIKSRQNDEEIRKTSLVGVHLDDIEIYTNNINLTTYGSHGQQRTVSFLLRLAQADQIEKRWKKAPIILLDDLKSELDSNHRRIVENILRGENQIMATATEPCFNGKEFLIIEI